MKKIWKYIKLIIKTIVGIPTIIRTLKLFFENVIIYYKSDRQK